MGLNFNSKYSSGRMITFHERLKSKDSRENNPGPGHYIRFSEFGILVSKNSSRAQTLENQSRIKIKKLTKLRINAETENRNDNNKIDEGKERKKFETIS